MNEKIILSEIAIGLYAIKLDRSWRPESFLKMIVSILRENFRSKIKCIDERITREGFSVSV